jgi:calcium permeable stress-gated cation channel
VYAPKLKHADEKHAPPPIGKSPWAWVTPLWITGETELIGHVGMDATIFIRFITMCRNMLLVLALIGIAILVPVNLNKRDASSSRGLDWQEQITPLVVWGDAHWAQVVVAWLFDLTICGFLWWNYRKVLQLRRKYFESEEYQSSLHARTLMV